MKLAGASEVNHYTEPISVSIKHQGREEEELIVPEDGL
jgi:hypothetical protein